MMEFETSAAGRTVRLLLSQRIRSEEEMQSGYRMLTAHAKRLIQGIYHWCAADAVLQGTDEGRYDYGSDRSIYVLHESR
jgi:hypothetical protein